uniref:Uncharacterized protein n=1 Tax=Arundo donax TaxID=35708 RepID=A0A0A9GX37_ARUDO
MHCHDCIITFEFASKIMDKS